ncbi:MAG: hypothetical protein JHD16_13265 [Solirubrobacteraceae bacterium]|nr:hypothetical protein [Solirubrobacteraceae bacterium]
MSARPTASTSLPPSLRETATGVAAWARLVALWAPLSVMLGMAVVGRSVDDVTTALSGFAAAVAVFMIAGSVEVRRAARRGATPLAAGALLATHAVVILAMGALFAGLAIAAR